MQTCPQERGLVRREVSDINRHTSLKIPSSCSQVFTFKKAIYHSPMRTLWVIPLFLLLSLIPSPGWGADFDKGLTAAQNGDFATALGEWTPLAEQGHAGA